MDGGFSQGKNGFLFKTSLEKAIFSSPAACIKSIENRLKKLRRKYPAGDFPDIASLEHLRDTLASLDERDFSRYQELLKLLQSRKYAWKPKQKDDRLVIFTERVETMKWLAEHLREYLRENYNLQPEAVLEISGELSDEEQQEIVENFGREKHPVRVLVASDVASEGLNFHYLSHRMIHFDMPWSLMAFRQRNGRIDRYGQKQPDIRCLKIESQNERIHGDMRILEILAAKEEAARENIGDPASLMGKYNQEDEERQVAQWLESGLAPESCEASLDDTAGTASAFDILMGLADEEARADTEQEEKAVADMENTIYKDYLLKAIPRITQGSPAAVRRLESRRCSIYGPCILFSAGSMTSAALSSAEEALIIGIDGLPGDEYIYVMSGSIPNQKSTPLVDSFFGLKYCAGEFCLLTMQEVMEECRLREETPNRDCMTDTQVERAAKLLLEAVEAARQELTKEYQNYKERLDTILDEEIDKLEGLHEKYKIYQLELFQNNQRQRESGLRRVDELFEEFTTWFQETLTIENNPYIRVLAVIMGAEA